MRAKLNIPRRFYYKKQVAGARLTDEDTGVFDWDALFDHQAKCWIDDSAAIAYEPKTLILTAWALANKKRFSGYFAQKKTLLRLLKLRPKAFDIKLMCHGQLVTISEENLDDILESSSFLDHTLVSKSHLVARLKKLGKPINRYEFLDDHSLRCMRGEGDPDNVHINLSDIEYVHTHQMSSRTGEAASTTRDIYRRISECVKSYFGNTYHGALSVVCDERNARNPRQVQSLLKDASIKLPEWPVSVKLTDDDVEEIIKTGGLHDSDFRGGVLSSSSIEKLEAIHYAAGESLSEESYDQLKFLLKCDMPALRYLTLSDYHGPLYMSEVGRMNNLIELRYLADTVDFSFIGKLSQHAPKLETVDLGGGNDQDLSDIHMAVEELGHGFLRHIKALHLSGDKEIKLSDLLALNYAAPELEHLTLSQCTVVDDGGETFSTIPFFANLQVLDVSGAQLAPSILNRFCNKENNTLRDLNLSRCRGLRGAVSSFGMVEGAMANLQKVNLELSSVDSQGVCALSQLIGMTPSLTHINISARRIGPEMAMGLLCGKMTPNVEEIQFEYCDTRHIGDKILGWNNHFPKLKVIKMSSSKAVGLWYDFNYLLSVSPNIEILRLPRMSETQEDICDLAPGSLKNLHTIGYSGHVVAEDWLALLAAAPNLTDLKLNITSKDQDVFDDPRFDRYRDLLRADGAITVVDTLSAFSGESGRRPGQRGGQHTAAVRPDHETYADADTHFNRGEVFNLKRKIYACDGRSLDPSHYRMQVYNDLGFSPQPCSVNRAFSLSSQGDVGLEECHAVLFVEKVDLLKHGESLQSRDRGKRYVGCHDLVADGSWQALPSLSSNEGVSHIQVTPNVACEVRYSQRDNMYYMRSTHRSRKPIRIEYLFQSTQPRRQARLPNCIDKEMKLLKKYKKKQLRLPATNLTGRQYLEAMRKQRVGACRHRAVVLKAFIDEYNSENPGQAYDCRVVHNDCHAYVEILDEGVWHKYDLGGYPADLAIEETMDVSVARDELERGGGIAAPDAVSGGAARAGSTQQVSRWQPEALHPDSSDFNVRLAELIPIYRARFTEHLRHQAVESMPEWLAQRLSGPRKELIKTTSNDDQNRALIDIYSAAKLAGRPIFFVEKPSDLTCSVEKLRLDEDGIIGVRRRSPLFDYLQLGRHEPGSKPIILIDYSNFEASDIIRFNDLLDDTSAADGVAVGDEFQIVGVKNENQEDCYKGEDFDSRFDQRKEHPSYLPSPVSVSLLPSGKFGGCSETEVVVNLYGAANWRQRLQGRWVKEAGQMVLMESDFVKALRRDCPIRILNGPKDDRLYDLFWKKLAVDGLVNGVPLPVDMEQIQFNDHCDWKMLASYARFNYVAGSELLASKDVPLVNSSEFKNLKSHTAYDESVESVREITGLLEKEGSLKLLVTARLSTSQWAELLDLANKNGVALQLDILPGIELPAELLLHVPAASTSGEVADKFDAAHPSTFISSTDTAVTVHNLLHIDPATKVIDITELKPKDLLVDLTQNEGDLSFTQVIRPMLATLQEGGSTQKFILKGRFSQKMLDALLPIVRDFPDRVSLIAEEPDCFTPFAAQLHSVTLEEKLSLLPPAVGVSLLASFTDAAMREELQAMSVSQLRALSRYQQLHPENVDITAAQRAFYRSPVRPIGLGVPAAVAEGVEGFHQRRKAMIDGVLDTVGSPYVFISGLTGVGKSTFINGYFKDEAAAEGRRVHSGMDKIQEWIATGGYLFIDEANITQRDWLEFDGLFDTPPTVFVDGVAQALPAGLKHKVIFAGNPLSTGGSRQQPELFERHGNAIWFDPIPSSVIDEAILQTIFCGTSIERYSTELSNRLLTAYDFLISKSTASLLITPRQIKSIAMMTVAACAKDASADPVVVIDDMIRRILHRLTPKHNLSEFDALFPAVPQAVASNELVGDFLLTPSRHSAASMLGAMLDLRQYRQSPRDVSLRPVQLFGGLSSLIFQSMPGLGKTEMLKAMLAEPEYRLRQVSLDSTEAEENAYYYLPAAASSRQKERILIKAFMEGNIVIMDEINSSPMMERLVNSLLMGKMPDGTAPTRPGFLLLGTQNPSTMTGSVEGRVEQTSAQANRTILEDLVDYPREEAQDIIEKQCEPQSQAKLHAAAMVHAYEDCRRDAEFDDSLESMNFRDLLRRADEPLAELAQQPGPIVPRKSSLGQSILTVRRKSEEVVRPLHPEVEAFRDLVESMVPGLHIS